MIQKEHEEFMAIYNDCVTLIDGISASYREMSQELREASQSMRESSQEMRESSQEMRESSQEMRESSQSMRESSQEMDKTVLEFRQTLYWIQVQDATSGFIFDTMMYALERFHHHFHALLGLSDDFVDDFKARLELKIREMEGQV
jgi:hypothetical protein